MSLELIAGTCRCRRAIRSTRRYDERSPRECCGDGDQERLPATDGSPRRVHESRTLLQRGGCCYRRRHCHAGPPKAWHPTCCAPGTGRPTSLPCWSTQSLASHLLCTWNWKTSFWCNKRSAFFLPSASLLFAAETARKAHSICMNTQAVTLPEFFSVTGAGDPGGVSVIVFASGNRSEGRLQRERRVHTTCSTLPCVKGCPGGVTCPTMSRPAAVVATSSKRGRDIVLARMWSRRQN